MRHFDAAAPDRGERTWRVDAAVLLGDHIYNVQAFELAAGLNNPLKLLKHLNSDLSHVQRRESASLRSDFNLDLTEAEYCIPSLEKKTFLRRFSAPRRV